jgi:hypothetical protein
MSSCWVLFAVGVLVGNAQLIAQQHDDLMRVFASVGCAECRFNATQACANSARATVVCSKGFVTRLVLSNLQAGGVVPTELGTLSALTALALDGALTGTVPSQLQRLTSLQALTLTHNNLTGALAMMAAPLTVACNLTDTCLDCPAVLPSRCTCVRASRCDPLAPTPTPPPAPPLEPTPVPVLDVYLIAGAAAGGCVLLTAICAAVVCVFLRAKRLARLHSLPLPSPASTQLLQAPQHNDYGRVSLTPSDPSASTASVSTYQPVLPLPIAAGGEYGALAYSNGYGRVIDPRDSNAQGTDYGFLQVGQYRSARADETPQFSEFASARDPAQSMRSDPDHYLQFGYESNSSLPHIAI